MINPNDKLTIFYDNVEIVGVIFYVDRWHIAVNMIEPYKDTGISYGSQHVPSFAKADVNKTEENLLNEAKEGLIDIYRQVKFINEYSEVIKNDFLKMKKIADSIITDEDITKFYKTKIEKRSLLRKNIISQKEYCVFLKSGERKISDDLYNKNRLYYKFISKEFGIKSLSACETITRYLTKIYQAE